ncbi:T9SS type A sorting domain-containing protein [Mucilaginibacter sp.]|jgi:hypothetical protein|uniref:T9SS type A sorting domain-containing protein n=1 Tax=Mucilaginibacter sp. TaxID=1882438 RepID=UPI002B8E4A19|nr:T9SS type A sorting domain-containing protein [Mucilaginibacter sp.]HTI57584.1 T9SS type A sorting domain-containing protein [Mucilaginibacter sp.]
MKQRFLKPGFEAVFALSIIAILGLPPLVFAQKNRDIEIKITNGDTVVNGKKINELSPSERKQALKDIDHLSDNFIGAHARNRVFIRKRNSDDTNKRDIIIERRRFNDGDMARATPFDDSTRNKFFKFRFRGPNGKDSLFTYNFRMNNDDFDNTWNDRDDNFMRDGEMMRRRMPMMMARMHRRNSQSFNYSNTGADGISTHVSFNVSDASPERTKKTTGAEKADLELTDLALVPEFSSGKTLLTFRLATHTAAEVKLTDNEGKLIWSDKVTNGSFSKSFPLGLNGIYLLEVKQGGKTALKRIIKEE